MSASNDIILFHYPGSPYGSRLVVYLTLRGLEYKQCIQPSMLPRPDLEALGVKYRRIPLLSIGRNMYCDTRLILQKLEERYPDGALGASDGEGKAVQRLFQAWTVESGVFDRAGGLIPTHFPIFKDEKFIKDRTDLLGRPFNAENLEKGRPENLAFARSQFEFLETTILADGREWLLKTDKPSLADIEAIWPFNWLSQMPGALPPELISEKQFPRVFAWIERFRAAVQAAESTAPKPVTLEGQEAVKAILSSDFAEPNGIVDANDPLGLKAGEEVNVSPIDWGSTHRDRGHLVTLTAEEVTVASRSKVEDKEVRIHAPRSGFRITKVGGPKM